MRDKDVKLFLLNNKIITLSDLDNEGYTKSHILLDFIRYNQTLSGTKIGCREGDCGACTVLIGTINDQNELKYKSAVSCLTPIMNVLGKHVVTIEGINLSNKLTLIQDKLVEEGGTQCGACTPGFIVSLTGLFLTELPIVNESVKYILDGNICRCTGYKSIERAAYKVISEINSNEITLKEAVENEIIPGYFLEVKSVLDQINLKLNLFSMFSSHNALLVGGGTDLYVQKPDSVVEQNLIPTVLQNDLNYIKEDEDQIRIGSATTFSDIMDSEILQKIFPNLFDNYSLIASTPIRNIATIGGNIVNASPIADTVIFFLVLDPEITLRNLEEERNMKLIDFYIGYKELSMEDDEIVTELSFQRPNSNFRFNFEKVSKRTYLDI
ncbi:MAG: FAD binding domain-containing protein, partial [Candidatus Kariarchaeaceae archaeon]